MSSPAYQTLDNARVARAKRSFTTRRVAAEEMTRLKVCDWNPSPGDLMLARVETIGQHTRIELPDGRRASLFPGDEIIVCCGSRYAPDQFEAELQDGVWPTDLVAAGGLASCELSRHARKKPATQIQPLGAVCGENGKPLNVANYALSKVETRLPIKVVLVAGTA